MLPDGPKGAHFTNLREILPPINRFRPAVEHMAQHQGLAMVFVNPYEPPGISRSDNLALMLLMEDLNKAGIERIVASAPANSSNYASSRGLFQLPGLPYFKARENDHIIVPQYMADGQSFLYLRDQMIQGTDESGALVFTSSVDANQSQATNGSLLYSLGNQFNIKTGMLPASLEGGNVIPTENHILTLRGTIAKNLAYLNERGRKSSPDEILGYLSKLFGGKSILVLDDAEKHQEPQTIFHLDLLLNGLQGINGEEFILVSSLRKAEQLLKDAGVIKNGKLDKQSFEKWVRSNATKDTKKEYAEERLEQHMKLLKAAGLPSDLFIEVRKMLKQLYFASNQALEDAIRNGDLYFNEKTSEFVKRTTDEIIDRLLKEGGFSQSQIIEVPGLIYPNKGIPNYSHNAKGDLITFLPAPYYTPANGIQLNLPGHQPEYFTVGGLKQFDSFTRSEIEKRTGIKTKQLPSLLLYGQSASGLRCLAIPVLDNTQQK